METLIAFFRSFKTITDDEAAIICSHFQDKDFKEGEYLFSEGKVCKTLFFIDTGILRIVTTNQKGTDVTYYFIDDKQFCTILQSFNEETIASEGIQACCDTHVLAISKKKLLELYQKLPLMADLINEIHQQRMLEKIRLKNAYSGHDAVERYQVFLSEQPQIAYRVPLNYIASYLNVTPQSLSRIRRKLA
ncbi:Crp/Fnr family transcriptional regulator [Pedobacter panaciterrae]|uniref:Crp/Fnr family transcriptional regulator n=1 Tax=Pedobacter panaciterrae TaxID=363849 RepID=A0ABU8NSE9_9SPHI